MHTVEDHSAQSATDKPADSEHPAWCSPDHCVTHHYDGWWVVAHASQPVQIKLFEHVLQVQLWHSEHHGEPEPDEGFIAAPLGPVISIRRSAPTGPSADDRHDLLPIYGARVLHRALGDLLAGYDR